MPHVRLTDSSKNGTTLSTLDLLKQNFILISTESSSPWITAAAKQSVPVDAHVLSKDSYPISDPEERVKGLYRLGSGHSVLVRPDGYIAWRSDLEPVSSNHDDAFDKVLKKILCR